MLNVTIKTIPSGEHRYPTTGDWLWKDGKLTILVSDLNDTDDEFLVAIHELVEAYLCKVRGITQREVDSWDKHYEKLIKEGLVPKDGEPGDDIHAPYMEEHKAADAIEGLVEIEIKKRRLQEFFQIPL